MRHLPRFALVPLAALVSIAPFAVDAVLARAGADTASDCAAAFTAAPAGQLGYTTVPAARLASIGQTVQLSARWDPSAWDGLTSAVACVQLNDAFDDALGSVVAAPADTGAFDHSFVVPGDVPDGSVVCARIRLAGDPAGPATEAVWVSKTHCFEVDTSVDDVAPPWDTTPTTVATTTSTTTPPVQPAMAPGPESAAPPAASPTPPAAGAAPPESGWPGPFSPEGGGTAPGTPVDKAAAPPASAAPAPPQTEATSARVPLPAPILPATGFTSAGLLHAGERSLSFGLALLVLFGRPRRRRTRA